jgi:hypothetical protein
MDDNAAGPVAPLIEIWGKLHLYGLGTPKGTALIAASVWRVLATASDAKN